MDLFKLSTPTNLPCTTDWKSLVEQIAADPTAGFESLHYAFRGFRWFFVRDGLPPQDAEEMYHGLMLEVFVRVQHGDLRDPERLPGYIKKIAVRMLIARQVTASQSRKNRPIDDPAFQLIDSQPDPESAALRSEQQLIMNRVMQAMSERERTVLKRFYLDGQRPEQIQQDMDLTETQFRLIKSRAKERFKQLTQARLARKTCRSLAGFSYATRIA